jgi:DHA1 family purine base/nucleoside efflux pump-like MFS transporter
VSSNPEKENKLLVPSLFISQLSTRPTGILMGLILADVAQTYNTTIGVAGQIPTAASIAGMTLAPFIAALTIKYKPRTLLLTGITFLTASALGCSIAPNYISLLIFYSLTGFGSTMVNPMIMTIIGENIPEEKKSGTIGLITASTPMLSTIAGLTIAYIIRNGWKKAYLVYAFPINLISLIITYVFLPKTPASDVNEQSKTSIGEGFRKILGYRSALACLFGTLFVATTWGTVMWYFISFYRQVYGVSAETSGVFWAANTLVFVVGSLSSGKIVPRMGYKRTTTLTSLILALCVFVFFSVNSLNIAVFSRLVVSFVSALWISGANSLALGQVPVYRGAMMSLNSGIFQLGMALGSAIGGLVINLGGYGSLGYIFGATGLLAYLVVSFFAVNPIIE